MINLKISRPLSYLDLNRSVLYGLLINTWSFITGPISMLLMVNYFTTEMQGYFYTFGSILALRVFFESGFGIVIVSFVSKEWANLSFNKDGEVEGDLTSKLNLFSLSKIVFKWHFLGGLIALFCLCFGGYLFFSLKNGSSNISWEAPWFFLCICTVINMWLLPSLFILEGCNQIRQLYSYRLIQGICSSIVLWLALIFGLGLWASALSALAGVITLIIFNVNKYKSFFLQIFVSKFKPTLSWKTHLLPMQFQYQGAEEAGKFGMTWSLFSVLGAFASTWISTKIPLFGIYVAKKDYVNLDKIFHKLSKITIGVFLIGAICIWVGIFFLNSFNSDFIKNLSNRFIQPKTLAILLLGFFFSFVTQPFAIYMRAHGKEPYFFINFIVSILICVFSWIFVKTFSTMGVAMVYFLIMSFFSFPCMMLIWYKFKKNLYC